MTNRMNYAEQMLGVRGNLNFLICNSVFSASKLRQLFGCVSEYFHNKVALAREPTVIVLLKACAIIKSRPPVNIVGRESEMT